MTVTTASMVASTSGVASGTERLSLKKCPGFVRHPINLKLKPRRCRSGTESLIVGQQRARDIERERERESAKFHYTIWTVRAT